ncbi:MAG: tRNA (N(6)-L-threonylcarbamoyladenosine(37)-C(2))-methylthiotransferase MtaB [Clostridia bacterium]|nr:tRNA (N(6)-L-threonylcarbamoyladenosine(37)-C(2))-methylthiotransferase MtaB [Clostridia bacterium]
MKYKIITLGCKANQYDSAYMSRLLTAAGHVADPVSPDVCIINSCTVTAVADGKSGKALRRSKREHPEAVAVLTGCLAQVKEDAAAAYPEADMIIGITEQRDIVRLLEEHMKNGGRSVAVGENNGEVSSFIEAFPEHSRAFLKIEDGCDNFCAYCVIPFARGRVRSKPEAAVLDEIAALTEGGYNELVLTGINMSAYGKDFDGSFLSLLKKIGEQGIAKRVRVSSIDPNLLTDEFIEAAAKMDFLCPHFHLSLQSGCDATLARMGRRYTTEFIASAAEKLRAAIPNVQFTGDVIVGFPGETEEEFATTCEFIKRLRPLDLHVFPYSRRKGTRAAAMPDQVPQEIKHLRSEKLIALENAIRAEVIAEAKKRPLEVLFETEKNGVFEGFSREYIPVKRKGNYRCGEVFTAEPEEA